MIEADRLSHVSLLSSVGCPRARATAMIRKLSPSIKATHSAIRMRDISARRYRDEFAWHRAYVGNVFLPLLYIFY
ncbi:hypothetical protein F3J19_00810 [Burkholderia sp. Ax-1724]|nr:hypothetical protein [Burkholderia sp. Ax-1724]NIF76668.1 hypothetical protein [Paraburkholderia sp. Cy-641]